jgi:hypothetical protein
VSKKGKMKSSLTYYRMRKWIAKHSRILWTGPVAGIQKTNA